MDLELPRIEPQAPRTDFGAAAIDRAGAKVEQAGQAVGDALLKQDLAQVAVQTQEATIQTMRGLHDTLQFVKSNPYLSPEQVRAAFGGKVPEGVRLTEQVTAPGETEPAEQDRKVIPMHEVAPLLFDQQSRSVLENAARNIQAPGWQQKFREAAATDVERARVETMDWQRAQFLADMETRSVAQFHQAVNARAWDTAQAILNNANYTMDPKTRETLSKELPHLRTQATVDDMLRSRDPRDLQRAIDEVDQNRVGKEENGFYEKLSPEEQLHYTTVARRRLHEVQVEQAMLEKRAQEQRFEAFGSRVQLALNASRLSGQPMESFISVTDIPTDIPWHEKREMVNFLDAMSKRERVTDNRVWLELANLDKSERLGQLSPAQMMSYWPGLSDQDQRTWMDRWASARQGRQKPLFSEVEDKAIDHVLTSVYKFKAGPQASADENDRYNDAKTLLQRNLLVWRQRHPDEPMLYDVVKHEARMTTFSGKPEGSLFGLLTGTQKSWMKDHFGDGDAESAIGTLSLGVRAAAPGRTVSAADLFDHVVQMDREKPEVERAWAALNPAAPLDGVARAAIHSVLINPVALQKIDEKLAREGRAPDQRNRVWRIVQEMQVPQSRELAAENERRAEQEAAARQVREAGERLSAEERARRAAARAESEAAARAERERVAALPYPLRQAERYAREQFDASEARITREVRARVYAEDRAAQVRAANGRAILGDRFADDPVRVEMERRIRAEVEAGRAGRKADWDAQMREARDAYRKYWDANMVDDSGSARLFAPPGFVGDFERWLQLHREGKL